MQWRVVLAKDLKVPCMYLLTLQHQVLVVHVDNDGAQGGNSIAIGPSSTVTKTKWYCYR